MNRQIDDARAIATVQRLQEQNRELHAECGRLREELQRVTGERDQLHRELVDVRASLAEMEGQRNAARSEANSVSAECAHMAGVLQEIDRLMPGSGERDEWTEIAKAVATALEASRAKCQQLLEERNGAMLALRQYEEADTKPRAKIEPFEKIEELEAGIVRLSDLRTVSEHGDDADRAQAMSWLVDDHGKRIVEPGEVITVERAAAREQVKVCDESGVVTIGFVLADQKVRKLPPRAPEADIDLDSAWEAIAAEVDRVRDVETDIDPLPVIVQRIADLARRGLAAEAQTTKGGDAHAIDRPSAGLVTSPPVGKAGGEEFRKGLPSEALRRVWREWEAIDHSFRDDGGAYSFTDAEHYRCPEWSATTADSKVAPVTTWGNKSFRPVGATWSHVESMAAKAKQDKPAALGDREWVCPWCGPGVTTDEDGCCSTCGRDAWTDGLAGQEPAFIREVNSLRSEVEKLKAELARFQRADVGEVVSRIERRHKASPRSPESPRMIGLVDSGYAESRHDDRGELLDIVRQQAAELSKRHEIMEWDAGEIIRLRKELAEFERPLTVSELRAIEAGHKFHAEAWDTMGDREKALCQDLGVVLLALRQARAENERLRSDVAAAKESEQRWSDAHAEQMLAVDRIRKEIKDDLPRYKPADYRHCEEDDRGAYFLRSEVLAALGEG